MSLEKYLEEFGDTSQSVRPTRLVRLSNLSSQEAELFGSWWPSLGTERRRSLISTLADLEKENVELDFNLVFRMCLKDHDALVREEAVKGLWESEDRNLIHIFLAMLKADSSERVRAAASIALGKFAALAEDGKLLDRDGIKLRDTLLKVAESNAESVEVKSRAIESLAPFGTAQVRELIRKTYERGLPPLKYSAVFAMGRNCNSQWREIIVRELGSRDTLMRREAAAACGALGDEELVPYLLSLIDDEDSQVQCAAVQAVGSIGGAVAKKVLVKCLRSSDDAIQMVAQEALKALKFEEDPRAFRFER